MSFEAEVSNGKQTWKSKVIVIKQGKIERSV